MYNCICRFVNSWFDAYKNKKKTASNSDRKKEFSTEYTHRTWWSNIVKSRWQEDQQKKKAHKKKKKKKNRNENEEISEITSSHIICSICIAYTHSLKYIHTHTHNIYALLIIRPMKYVCTMHNMLMPCKY